MSNYDIYKYIYIYIYINKITFFINVRPPLVEMLLSPFSGIYVSMRRALIIDYIFIFYILRRSETVNK